MHFDEPLSTKIGHPTMKKHMRKHFRKPVKTYEVDVVDTFEAYFDRLSAGMDELFLTPIPNPGSRIWYAKSVVGETTLDHLVNFVLLESRVFNPDEVIEGRQNVTNKSGRTTMITRMCEMGVPNEVGMLLSGHKSRGAYKRYDQSSNVRVKVAQRCAAEPICYEDALEEERAKMKWMIFGKEAVQRIEVVKDIEEDVSPNKKPKVVPIMAHPKAEVIDTKEDKKGKEIMKRDQMPEPVMEMRRDLQKDDMEFLEKFDWEADYKEWFADRCLAINPIHALIGKLGEGYGEPDHQWRPQFQELM